QRAVMEFLLINHPLDCPICDQGGECELQDLSMGFGSADSFYTFGKRSVEDEDLGPLVATEMTRCIQCTRCVRFGDEIAGLRELGATGRGEDMEIGTYIQKAMHSEISGNIIDLCPVGALTSKPFRFTARAWELNQYKTIAPHDCVGSNIYAHTRTGKVMRIVPRENKSLNETWISDRDRFSYEGLYHSDRLVKPMVRMEGVWQETDWQTALEKVARELQHIITRSGAEEIGALASPNSTVEEFYLLQKLMRQLGSNHIDHRLRQTDFSDEESMPLFPGFNASFSDIEESDVILLVGSHLHQEQPLLATRVRKAVLKGARVIAINMLDAKFHFKVTDKKIIAPHHFVEALAGIAKALSDQPAFSEIKVTDQDRVMADILRNGKKVCVLLGIQAFNHPNASHIRSLSTFISNASHAALGFLTEGANAAGAWLAGAIPHRKAAGAKTTSVGFNAKTLFEKPRKAYLLFNIEPELDCANGYLTESALEEAECVVAFTVFKNPNLAHYAHVMLPIAPFTETSGTFVNVIGEWQTFKGVATPYGESRPLWKILRVLGNLLHLDQFDYKSTKEIRDELKSLLNTVSENAPNENKITQVVKTNITLSRIGEIPLYAGDSLLRRAKALQATQVIIEGNLVSVRIHSGTAKDLQIKNSEVVTVSQGDQRLSLPAILDDRIPKGAAYVAGGILATSQLTELFGPIEIQKT
ncbi:MAG: hypothetical protein ACD_60C00008G0006, partial [uncultured bacterium]